MAASGEGPTDLPRYIDPVGRRASLVTPDAVAIDLPLADVGTRGLAMVIDVLVMGVCGWMVSLAFIALIAFGAPPWVFVSAIIVLSLAVTWGYPITMEVLAGGQTVGKMALGLRVVTVGGGPVRFRHAALRATMLFVDLWMSYGLIGLVTMASTRRVQRLGDLAAGTVVIRSRVGVSGEALAMIFAVPPHLTLYAQSLDVAGLDAEDYAILRGFLLRAPKMKPAPRRAAGERLATIYARRIAHQPPAGTPPEMFLLCLTSLIQARDERRTAAAQGRLAAQTGTSAIWDPFSPATPSPDVRDRIPSAGQMSAG